MKFSVIIPAYKAEGCLTRAVESVQAQTLQDFEIIIVDDASPDGTRALAEQLAENDKRIRVLSLPQNGGPSAARNAGFVAAKGEWLAILDADDAFLPERLEKLLVRAEAEQLDVLADDLIIYDGTVQREAGRALNLPEARLNITAEHYLENDFSGGLYAYGVVKPIMRRTFIQARKVAYPVAYRHGEDSHFYTQALLEGARFGLIPEAYYLYTATVGPLSGKKSAFSQTKVDFFKKAQSCLDVLQAYQQRLSPKSRQLLMQRYKRNLSLHGFQLLKRGKFVPLLKHLCTYPHTIWGIPIAVARKVWRKFFA